MNHNIEYVLDAIGEIIAYSKGKAVCDVQLKVQLLHSELRREKYKGDSVVMNEVTKDLARTKLKSEMIRKKLKTTSPELQGVFSDLLSECEKRITALRDERNSKC